MLLYVRIKSDNIFLNKLLLPSGGRSDYLVPRIQQHDIVLAEIILSEASHLGDNEASRLI